MRRGGCNEPLHPTFRRGCAARPFADPVRCAAACGGLVDHHGVTQGPEGRCKRGTRACARPATAPRPGSRSRRPSHARGGLSPARRHREGPRLCAGKAAQVQLSSGAPVRLRAARRAGDRRERARRARRGADLGRRCLRGRDQDASPPGERASHRRRRRVGTRLRWQRRGRGRAGHGRGLDASVPCRQGRRGSLLLEHAGQAQQDVLPQRG